jgi:cell division protein FtsB
MGISVISCIAGTVWIQSTFNKLKEYKALTQENKALKTEAKTLKDSLQLHKEWLAKSLIDTRNATELYTLTKGMTTSFQSVIAVMRDSVIKINKDRVQLERRVLELQKDLEQARKKRRFL